MKRPLFVLGADCPFDPNNEMLLKYILDQRPEKYEKLLELNGMGPSSSDRPTESEVAALEIICKLKPSNIPAQPFSLDSIINFPAENLIQLAVLANNADALELLLSELKSPSSEPESDTMVLKQALKGTYYKGLTPLQLAVMLNNKDMIKMLCDKYRELDFPINDPVKEGMYLGDTPLSLAAFKSSLERTDIFQLLISEYHKSNIPINEKISTEFTSNTMLNLAIAYGGGGDSKLSQVLYGFLAHYLSSKSDIDIEEVSNDHYYPGCSLFRAIRQGAAEDSVDLLIKSYIERKININKPLSASEEHLHKGYTPLHLATQLAGVGFCETNVVRLLLSAYRQQEYKLNETVNSGMDKGFTPLYIAAAQGVNPYVVGWLIIEYKARGCAIDEAMAEGKAQGITPLYAAALNGVMQSVQLFIEAYQAAGKDIRKPMEEGACQYQTPFHAALLSSSCQFNADIAALFIPRPAGEHNHVNISLSMLSDDEQETVASNLLTLLKAKPSLYFHEIEFGDSKNVSDDLYKQIAAANSSNYAAIRSQRFFCVVNMNIASEDDKKDLPDRLFPKPSTLLQKLLSPSP